MRPPLVALVRLPAASYPYRVVSPEFVSDSMRRARSSYPYDCDAASAAPSGAVIVRALVATDPSGFQV